MQPTPRATPLLFLLTLLLTTGCANTRNRVTIRTDENRTLYAQSFDQAYIASSGTGEYDIVLVDDAQSKPAPSADRKKFWSRYLSLGASAPTARPLQPIGDTQLKQVVHLHVFWQAEGGSVARDGVVTNAAIDWYVIANQESDRPEVLHYEGAGYVLLDPGRGATSVEIRDGSMKMSNATTGLTDPIGPSNLRGKIKARRNPQLVRDTLADLKSRTPTPPTTVSQNRWRP
jgi:hypothetical protein